MAERHAEHQGQGHAALRDQAETEGGGWPLGGGEKAAGDPVHVEIDVLARYAERLLADRERAEVPVRGVEREDVGVESGQ